MRINFGFCNKTVGRRLKHSMYFDFVQDKDWFTPQRVASCDTELFSMQIGQTVYV